MASAHLPGKYKIEVKEMNYIDTRDLQRRIEELGTLGELNEEEKEELADLTQLKEDVGDEFKDGVTLIPDYEFEDYARELAEDIGAIGKDCNWPVMYIDWERAARELSMDYSQVTYEGTDYLFR